MAAFFCAATAKLRGEPFSNLSFEAASNQADQTGKIVLVDFYTTWCGPCKMLDKTTWTDPAIIQLLDQKTVALRVDAEKEAVLAKRYKIEVYPSVLLIKPDGTEIDRLVGYSEPSAFIADFNAALTGKDSVSRAEDKLMGAGTNDASARMQFGMALAQKGRDTEALAQYVWCFDQGAEVDPAFAGVRASFLLMSIKSLAGHYPPAQQALETRRDERQARVAAGATDYSTMQDLIALNEALGQKDKNLVVYDQLPPGGSARGLVAGLLTGQFLASRRYADVLQGTDGTPAFTAAVERFKLMLPSLSKDNPRSKELEENVRAFTVNEGAQGFEALAGLKRNEDGKNLAGQILKFDSSEATRTSLIEAAQRSGNVELTQYVRQ